MSDEIADIRSAETVPVVEGNTKPSVFVRAVRLRGVQEPMHVRTSTQGTLYDETQQEERKELSTTPSRRPGGGKRVYEGSSLLAARVIAYPLA